MERIENIDNLSCQDLAKEILANISERTGVDLYEMIRATEGVNSETLMTFKQHIVRDALIQFRKTQQANPEEDFGDCTQDDEALVRAVTDAEAEPNWMFNPADFPIIKSYEGKDVLTYLKALTKRFEQMTHAGSPGKVASLLLGGGLVGLGARAGYFTWKAHQAGAATMRAAVATGVRNVGMVTVVAAAAVILAMFLFWLAFDNPKNVLGLVINQSEKDLVVKNYGKSNEDIFMESGKIKNFMEDQESLSSPKVQIKGGYIDPDTPKESFYFGGVYFAQKKDGFFGAEGLFVLKPKDANNRIAVMFACPYSQDNGCNMKVLSTKETSLKKLYDELYKTRKVKYGYNKDGYVFQSRINSNRGGNVGNIACIQLPS